MSSDANKKAPWYANPMFWGVAGTVVLFAIYGRLAFVVDCDATGLVCRSKWSQFVSAAPNEIGDTLAGLAGALAFLWIIVTVMLQSQELREQRAEMKLQRDEFEKMVEAQEKQVEALQAQADVFLDEKKARDEAEAQRHLEELLRTFLEVIDTTELRWDYFTPTANGGGNHSTMSFATFPTSEGPLDLAVKNRLDELLHCYKTLLRENCAKSITKHPYRPKELDRLVEIVEKMLELNKSLSSSQSVRFDRLAIETFRDIFQGLDRDEYWNGDGEV